MRPGTGKLDEKRLPAVRESSTARINCIADIAQPSKGRREYRTSHRCKWSRSVQTGLNGTRPTRDLTVALWSDGQVRSLHRKIGMGWYIRIALEIRVSEL
jgi:hypothetical protein